MSFFQAGNEPNGVRHLSQPYNKDFHFFAVRYPCFLANQIASFAVRYFTIRTAQRTAADCKFTI